MKSAERGDRIEVLTTDIHLPQWIGKALESAYDGELSVRCGSGQCSVRGHSIR